MCLIRSSTIKMTNPLFVAYDCMGRTKLKESCQLNMLEMNGANVIYWCCSKLCSELCSKRLKINDKALVAVKHAKKEP